MSIDTITEKSTNFYYENEVQETDVTERSKGTITEFWNEDEIYNNLSSMIGRYLYIKGKKRIIIQFILYSITLLLFVGKDYFVGALSLDVYHLRLGMYLLLIFSFWVVAEVVSMFRNKSFHERLLSNGNYLNELMIKILFRLKLGWLNSHPSARVWFKYSYDLRLIDEKLNHNIQHFIEYAIFLVGSILVVNVLYLGMMVIPSILIGWYFLSVFKRYIRTEKKLFKFEAEYESKMYDVLLLSIDQEYKYRIMKKGILLRNRFIRVSNQLERVRIHVDYYSHRWLGVRLMIINVVVIFLCYLVPTIIVLYLEDTWFKRTIIELYLAIIWSLKFTYYLQHMLESMIQVLDDEVSFGRIEHYLKNAKVECRPTYLKEPNYYSHAIDIRNLNCSMANRKILDNFGLKIKKGQKVALVGHHGSGKHTLFGIILMNFEKDPSDKTKLEILGYDYDQADPNVMREKIEYLRNHPYLFSGTVRLNIDPEVEHSDEEICRVLHLLGGGKILNEIINT